MTPPLRSPHQIRNIDFIYMINLDERPEKFARASEQLRPYGITPYRFSAVNGWKIPNSKVQELGVRFERGMKKRQFGTVYRLLDEVEYVSHEPIDQIGTTYFAHCFARGAMGVILSHLGVLRAAYDSGFSTIWVMEDDIEVLSDPNELSDSIDRLDKIDPDWDLLYTDPDSRTREGKLIPCAAVIHRPNFTHPPMEHYQVVPIDDHFTKKPLRYGTYSMIFRRAGMKKVLDFFERYRIFGPYDADLLYTPGLRAYCTNKGIVASELTAASDNGSPGYRNGDGIPEIPEPYRRARPGPSLMQRIQWKLYPITSLVKRVCSSRPVGPG